MATILAFYMRGAHWRHLPNTTELFMCGGDATLCQITLITYYYYYYSAPHFSLQVSKWATLFATVRCIDTADAER